MFINKNKFSFYYILFLGLGFVYYIINNYKKNNNLTPKESNIFVF